MHPIFATLIVLAAGIGAWLGTRLVERHASRWGLVQAPNVRSSHALPTPRGGGIAIAVAAVMAGLTFGLGGTPLLVPVAALAAAAAALGFADDLLDLSPALRFPLQIALFALLYVLVSPLPALALGPHWSLAGALLAILVVLVGVWWLNLFNFIDGIDGIAASQAILVLLGAACIWCLTAGATAPSAVFWLSLAIAAAAAGFLQRNWPPARIFMGDAGSYGLAFLVFAIALLTIADGALPYASWLILPAATVTDATVTLLRRLARGEKPWQAHRRHAYQQLARRWGHQTVTLLFAALTALWTAPLAAAAAMLPAWQWPLALLAYAPLIVVATAAGAGSAAETSLRVA
ncbi:glycosyl transferase family 4 [Devosia sp. 1566]|uniref:glycosyl transferase family 4 n=1 Tax=Devosia sp. 1566 TaxID=2499144 RepID=UPI000FDC0F61|nr:glycosyl transferase family 4 [Devosia sp. 1566]